MPLAEQEQDAVCSICDKQVVDPTNEEDGDDAVFCEEECQSWLHQNCTCLPKSEFVSREMRKSMQKLEQKQLDLNLQRKGKQIMLILVSIKVFSIVLPLVVYNV